MRINAGGGNDNNDDYGDGNDNDGGIAKRIISEMYQFSLCATLIRFKNESLSMRQNENAYDCDKCIPIRVFLIRIMHKRGTISRVHQNKRNGNAVMRSSPSLKSYDLAQLKHMNTENTTHSSHI